MDPSYSPAMPKGPFSQGLEPAVMIFRDKRHNSSDFDCS